MLESCQFVSFSELCYLGHLEFLYYYYWVNKNQLSPLLKIIYSQISRQEYLTFQCLLCSGSFLQTNEGDPEDLAVAILSCWCRIGFLFLLWWLAFHHTIFISLYLLIIISTIIKQNTQYYWILHCSVTLKYFCCKMRGVVMMDDEIQNRWQSTGCSSVRELYRFWYLSEFFRQLANILGKITPAVGKTRARC